MTARLLKSLVRHPLAGDADIDAPETTISRGRLIQQKAYLRHIYEKWYAALASWLPTQISGPVLELGSGGGFFREHIPDLILSDILQVPTVDVVLDGCKLPFANGCLRGIVMVDVFHHIPSVGLLLSEAARCVMPGGVVVMTEPWATPWSRLVYRYLHHECFDPAANGWDLDGDGPLSRANSALPWIVFQRDREVFRHRFAEFDIRAIHLHSPFCYLLSGGVSYRSFLPGGLFSATGWLERKMVPWMHFWAMFADVMLVRR